MDHTEFIMEIKNIISQDFIDKILPIVDKKAKKKFKSWNGMEERWY